MLAPQTSLEPLMHGDELRLCALCLVPLSLAAPLLCVTRTWLCGVVCSGGASKSIWEGGITSDSVKCKSPLARESEFLLDPFLKVPPTTTKPPAGVVLAVSLGRRSPPLPLLWFGSVSSVCK